jgi:hypothetical protein
MKENDLFIFDQNSAWGAALSEHLAGLVPAAAVDIIRSKQPQFMEDAAKILLSAGGPNNRQQIIRAITSWIESRTIAVYHGSRLDGSDLEDIRRDGLLALVPEERNKYLEKKLSGHPRWESVKANLEPLLLKLSEKYEIGDRMGQVHGTLSRAGLLKGFNHYLTHGSEFDQHVAYRLLEDDGMELLAKYGNPVLITLAVPGDKALDAANPFREIGGEIPNVVREVIQVWSYWLVHRDFSAATQRIDCGFMFYQDIPAGWIHSVEEIELPSTKETPG